MFRFVHAADIHLDSPLRGLSQREGAPEAEIRGASRRAFVNLVGLCLEEAVDGEYQAYQVRGGAYTREHFFGKYPELAEMVRTMADEDIWPIVA